MSIPGLGQIPAQPVAASSTRTIQLQPLWEWRFELSFGAPAVVIMLLSGTAERDGTELARGHSYSLGGGTKSKIMTWHGGELEVTGSCADEFIAEYQQHSDTPTASYLNLHLKLAALRAAAARPAAAPGSSVPLPGPRVLVAGPPSAGKTTLVRTLAAYAARMSSQPVVVNTSPREGMLSLPGTFSAAVFATAMDPQTISGWGDTPTSGPSVVPVKLPLVYYYGRPAVDDDPDGYRDLVRSLASAVTARLAQDPVVGSSGLLVDTPGFAPHSKIGIDTLAFLANELAVTDVELVEKVNIVVVLGAERMYTELTKRLSGQVTRLGAPIQLVHLNKSEGVVNRDDNYIQALQEFVIKEYFFGRPGLALGPFTQTVDFDALVIYQFAEGNLPPQNRLIVPTAESSFGSSDSSLVRAELSPDLDHWLLAVMAASVRDPPDVVRTSTVLGFVNVAHVDVDRKKLRILAPVSGRLGDRPLIRGRWPEPCMNLLG